VKRFLDTTNGGGVTRRQPESKAACAALVPMRLTMKASTARCVNSARVRDAVGIKFIEDDLRIRN